MTDWLIPIALFLALLPALNALSRAMSPTGRPRVPEGRWRFVAPLGCAAAVIVVGASFDAPLPWLAFTAGLSAGILGLLVQFFAGRSG